MAKTLGIRNNPVKDQREQAFKQAALKVFSSKGYHKATMQEIAVEAGFGKGTLYWYWKSKEELYFSLVRQMHEEFLHVVEAAAREEGGFFDKIIWMGDQITELYHRNRDFCKLSWKMRAEELETFSPEYVEQLHDYVKRTKQELAKIVRHGIEEGALPQVDPYYLACILLGLIEGMEIQWLEDSQSFDLGEGMEIGFNFLLNNGERFERSNP
jgi:TetR/AcrR family transcriptional regulator, fatty acid metabolism regulator protein